MSRGGPREGGTESQHAVDVLVIGAGVAGTGAALAAANAGAAVTLLDGGTGASTLATGALDCVPWSPGRPSDDALASEVTTALEALDAYAVPEGGVILVTTAGLVRNARGQDRALLDVRRLDGRVGVAAARRAGWDGEALARAWSEPRAGLASTTPFDVLDAVLTRFTDEESIPDADFAARHDADDRLGWLAARLREALARARGPFAAIALPPMLGIDRPRADLLSRRVGLPCGEASGLPGGAAGLRFERTRDRALAATGVARVCARVAVIERRAARWRVTGEAGEPFDARAVILATGGLVGGGLAYAPSDAILATELPRDARLSMRLTVVAPFVVGTRGRPLQLPASLFGYAPESLARPFANDALLERAGVLALRGEGGDTNDETLLAAGDVVADEPRTWLGALASGVRAGVRAAAAGRRPYGDFVARGSDGAIAR